jgi:hypothetical protein
LIKKELSQAMEEMYHLQNCELAMGEYYQQLAERFPPAERLFWEEAISDEVNHARMVGRIIALVSSSSNLFRPGKYRVAVLETFLAGIYENVELMRKGALNMQQMLKIAGDYEDSTILLRPYDIVESLDPKFQDFRKGFAEEINEHSTRMKQFLSQKLGLQNNTAHIRLQESNAAAARAHSQH